jgi:hypothetical protein
MNYLLVYAFVLLQSIVSIKPGFVDIADGKNNVRKYEQLNAGSTVQTGPQSHVEIGLGLDVLLRLDENSAAVLESVDSANVSVRLESGAALLEVANLDKPKSIRITTGDVRTRIDSKGVFRFSENSVSVIDGKLMIDGGPLVQKGWKATNVGGDYRQSRLVLNTPEPFRAFLNSPKAGFVNAVQGKANLRALEVARSDRPIQTEASSYVEVLLSPGTFMRVDENSSVNIDSTGLNDVVIRVISGSILIEDVVSDPRLPVRVNIGGTKTVIATAGLYRFTSETALVIDGVLRYGQKDEAATAGTEVRIVDQYYQTRDVTEDGLPSGLDLWSAQRSHMLARSSFMSDYSDTDPSFFLFASPIPYNAAWVHSPSLDGITFVPMLTRRSYYGDSFVPLYMFLPTMSPHSRMLLPTAPVSQTPPSAKPSPTTVPTPTPAPKPATTPVPSQK